MNNNTNTPAENARMAAAERTTPKAGMTALERVLAQATTTAHGKPGARAAKTPKPCCGGCGEMTRGGNWFPGHDGRVHGRAAQLLRRGATAAEVALFVTCSPEWDIDLKMSAIEAARVAVEVETGE